ncbi:aldolase/citrate lyase family protein [Gammaproteobacteria bacterium]|nr:aldolase/citrate lyase family protein [Gammaproteobacteria bacterium]
MNQLEREMIDILKELREEYGAVSVKAEFEAEGTRTDELLRLIDLARRVDLKVGLKIGGCEAVRDLIESKQFGTEYIIAPMVETKYALQKYILAVNKVYSKDQQKSTDFLYNVETINTYDALNEMSETAKNASEVQGMVFGRVDFVTSLGMPRSDINTQKISEYVLEVAKKSKECGLDLVVGGGVAIEAIDLLKEIKNIHLSRFETRKVVFSSSALDNPNMDKGLEKTVYFELLWLKNKHQYYQEITNEDNDRIKMLEARWQELSKN